MVEIAWRHYTHWTMLITGGVCFLVLFRIYNCFPKINLFSKCLIGASVITAIELISGFIVNIWLNMGVWDYSSIPINFKGQICLLYTFLWGLLCIPISFVSDKIQNKYLNKAKEPKLS